MPLSTFQFHDWNWCVPISSRTPDHVQADSRDVCNSHANMFTELWLSMANSARFRNPKSTKLTAVHFKWCDAINKHHGDTVAKWFVLPPQSKKIEGSVPGLGLTFLCACSPCVCVGSHQLLSNTPKHASQANRGTLIVHRCVSVNDCLSLCGHAMNWWHGHGVTLPLPYDSWDRLRQTPVTLNSWLSGYGKWV